MRFCEIATTACWLLVLGIWLTRLVRSSRSERRTEIPPYFDALLPPRVEAPLMPYVKHLFCVWLCAIMLVLTVP
jgi:hypothetical protein